jgi:hypothetical protein
MSTSATRTSQPGDGGRGTEPLTDEERDAEVLALRDIWLSRLMFNVFVGWPPETRSFDEFLAAYGV